MSRRAPRPFGRAGLALAALVAAGCVEGLAPGEVGLGRRVDVAPGPIAAVLPPLTDLAGDVFVATGQPGADGAAQPGKVYAGGARGGWSAGCPTGAGPDGGAAGWVGATGDRAWLWTHDAVVEITASGACTTRLDVDPRSGSDLRFEAVAPVLARSISADLASAIVRLAADGRAYLVTVDLGLGTVVASTPLPDGARVLGGGGGGGQAAFLVQTGDAAELLLATPTAGLTGRVAVAGAPAAIRGEVVLGADGSVAAVLADGQVLVGDRAGVRVEAAPLPAAGAVRDDDGGAWLTAPGPMLARVRGGRVDAPVPWTSAAAAAAALARGVDVLDERAGGRGGARWTASTAVGDAPLVAAAPSLPFAVGARGWLVGDPPVDRGGIAYRQLAFMPIGVSFP